MSVLGPLLIGLIIGAFTFEVAMCVPAFFYARRLNGLLIRLIPSSRSYTAGDAYFELIPVLGLYWQFRNVLVVERALESECRSAGRATSRAGLDLGIAKGCARTLAYLGFGVVVGLWDDRGPVFLGIAACLFLVVMTALAALWWKYWRRILRFSGSSALEASPVRSSTPEGAPEEPLDQRPIDTE